MAEIYIGTSGFSYPHWGNGIFYPKDLPKNKQLEYFSQYFKTVEINSSFYRLPQKSTLLNWKKRTPENFLFALKVWRGITHLKKLKDCQKEWRDFLERVLVLKEKLGPILFQLPPSFKEDTKILEKFFQIVKTITPFKLRLAFEFRNESWCNQEVYQILKKENCAWVIADSPSWPKREIVTADFVYIRMHGSRELFASKYTKTELKNWAEKIKKWQKKNLDVYCYFNNDARGWAVSNAKEIIRMIKKVF